MVGVLLAIGAFQPGVFAGDPDTDQQGGIAGTGIVAMGPVQRFGSIFVNGREYFLTAGTLVNSEDDTQRVSELHLGDVVIVDGRLRDHGQRGDARTVTVQLALRGRVQTVDIKTSTLVVLGQTVHVSVDTFGENAERVDLSRVRVGAMVEISGLMRADGSWTATRVVGSASDSTGFVLRGAVRSLNRERNTVQIGDAPVLLPARASTASLQPGQVVRIAGRYGAGDVLRGTRLVVEKPELGGPGTRIEMSGHIQSIPAAGTAVCNGIVLQYGTGTSTSGGATVDIAVGMPVTLRGVVDSTGGIVVQDMVLRSEFLHVNLPRQGAGNQAGPAARARNGDSSGVGRPQLERPQIERPNVHRPEIERPNLPQH